MGDLVGRWRAPDPLVLMIVVKAVQKGVEVETSHPHIPVLRDRCLELLEPALSAPGAVVVDATLGAGGHSAALLEAFAHIEVIGIDRDRKALSLAQERIAALGSQAAQRFNAVHAVYDEIPAVLANLGLDSVAGVLFDLGVSSMQLDEADRGFSYAQDAPLDMRMDPDAPDSKTAAQILATATQADLVHILRAYGEEKFAPHIARAIVQQRATSPIETSAQLVELIRETIPAAARRTGGNPAKRTFQALRIAVNSELEVLERAIPAAIDAIPIGGRVVAMSYQSLEDRIVKRAFAAGTQVLAPPDMPVVPVEAQPYLRLLTRGAEKASAAEIAENRRAKPVRLRAIERVRNTPDSRRGGVK